MKILLALVLSSILAFTVAGQKECFTKKTATTSQSGPLKMSLTDSIKDFESGIYSSNPTGSYTIVNKNTQEAQRYTCFNITFLYINGKKSYEVAACTFVQNSAIQNVENYQDKEGLDFSIRFSPNPTVIEGLFIMAKTAIWTSVSIHYVITARQDFRVGTFVPQTAQFLPCGRESQDLVISHKLIRSWNASKKLVFGLPFLSGIRTMDTEININFNKSSFDADTNLLQIPISFGDVQYPVQYMLISYLIVTMDSEFQITNIYDLDYIPSDINVFVGMTGVKTGSIVSTTAAAATSTTTNTSTASIPSGVLKYAATTVTNKNKFREYFEVQGLVIQSTSNLDVLFSSGNYSQNSTIECISAEKCSSYDGYMKYYQNEDGFAFKSECILCEAFASYSNVSGQCECRELYLRVNGSCVLKQNACDQKNQVYNNQTLKCDCAQGYTLKNGTCTLTSTCPQGYTSFRGVCYKVTKVTNSTTAATASTTTQTTITQTQTCQSPMTYNSTSKACQCPSSQYYDDSTKACLSCSENQAYNTKTKLCQCVTGSFKINGVCEFCSTHGFFNGSGCQCLPGYIGNGKICREDPTFTNQTLGLTAVVAGNKDTDSSGVTAQNLSKENDSQPIVLGQITLN